MALVATVNGTPVYSNKQVSSIVNGQITFTDGSWCDVTTGTVQNNGSGYINIGGHDAGSTVEKTTHGPVRVSASSLQLKDLTADVQVDVHSAGHVEYTIVGPAGLVEAIQADVRGGTLVIAGSVGRGASSASVVIGGAVFGNGVVISNVFGRGSHSTVVFGGQSNPVTINVRVPKGAAVDVDHVQGNVVIGDTEGPLAAQVSSGNVNTGQVTDARLSIQGSGDIVVSGGAISSLEAAVQGSGDIHVGGTVTTADLQVHGSGNIAVDHVLRPARERVRGSGDIRVRRTG